MDEAIESRGRRTLKGLDFVGGLAGLGVALGIDWAEAWVSLERLAVWVCAQVRVERLTAGKRRREGAGGDGAEGGALGQTGSCATDKHGDGGVWWWC